MTTIKVKRDGTVHLGIFLIGEVMRLEACNGLPATWKAFDKDGTSLGCRSSRSEAVNAIEAAWLDTTIGEAVGQ